MSSVASPLLLAAPCSPTTLPAAWATQLDTQLAGSESVLAWLEIDLDASLRFAAGWWW
jgi:ATP-binding cassette subfamily B protein